MNKSVPSFVRATIRTAATGRDLGYFGAGRALAPHIPGVLDDENADARMKELEGVLFRADDSERWHEFGVPDEGVAGVRKWFKQNLPGIAKLIPARPWKKFVQGIYDAVHEDGFEY